MDRRLRELQRRYQQDSFNVDAAAAYIRALERAQSGEEEATFNTAYWEQKGHSPDRYWMQMYGQPLRGTKELLYSLYIPWFLKRTNTWKQTNQVPKDSEIFALMNKLSKEGYKYLTVKFRGEWSHSNGHTRLGAQPLTVAPPAPPVQPVTADIIVPAHVYEGHGYINLPNNFRILRSNFTWAYQYIDDGQINARYVRPQPVKVIIRDHTMRGPNNIPLGGIPVNGRTQITVFNENVANNMKLKMRFRAMVPQT